MRWGRSLADWPAGHWQLVKGANEQTALCPARHKSVSLSVRGPREDVVEVAGGDRSHPHQPLVEALGREPVSFLPPGLVAQALDRNAAHVVGDRLRGPLGVTV